MKRRVFYTALLLVALLTLAACVKEDYFGKSNLKQVFYFNVPNQLGAATILQDSLKIYITVAPGTDVTALAPDSVLLSTFATITPGVGMPQDFSTAVPYTVTAEDGSFVVYEVFVEEQGSEPQLENTGFDDWYTPTGKNYQQPGLNSSSIWATANDGVTTTGNSNYNTTPELVSGTDYLAKLETKDLGPLAQVTGQRIGAATLFTGKFVLNITDPPASAQFGIPFTARPASFTASLNYFAGTPYKNGNNQTLNKTDSADVYVLLENRNDPTAIKRVATGWLRMGASAGTSLEAITVNMIYGPLPETAPDYQKPINNLYAGSGDKVTHITVVFASSAQGILYEGGIGSTLKVNNFRLNY